MSQRLRHENCLGFFWWHDYESLTSSPPSFHPVLKVSRKNLQHILKNQLVFRGKNVKYTYYPGNKGFPDGSVVKNLSAMQETWVWSLGWENPLEKEMATHSSILPWEIPWTEEPGRLQSMELQRAGQDLATKQQQQPRKHYQYLSPTFQLSGIPEHSGYPRIFFYNVLQKFHLSFL